MHFDLDLEHRKDLKNELLGLWDSLISEETRKNCFGNLGKPVFISSKLSPQDNVHPIGPAIQFYNTFDILKKEGFDHWFQMEPDVLPIRGGWASKIYSLAAANTRACEEWIMLGSGPRCYRYYGDIAERKDHHINATTIAP